MPKTLDFTADNAKRRYQQRIVNKLKDVARAARECGLKATATDNGPTDDEYAWSNLIYPKGNDPADEGSVEARLTITEELQREGEGTGMAFHFSLVGYGGSIVGDFCPYNYTPELWCHSWDELDARFETILQLNPSEAARVIVAHIARERGKHASA